MPRRQSIGSAIVALVLTLGVAGCTTPSGPSGPPFGGAAADEPRAAVIARNALDAGGSAADAAIAAFFAMTVTYPAAASLGGGGTCVVHRPDPAASEVLDFPVRTAARGGPIGVPGVLPAMYALHARYGKLRWENDLAASEQLARFGHPMSRAAALALRATSLGLLDNAPEIYAGKNGQELQEGETFRNAALGATIGRLRTIGAQDLHRGQLSRALLQDIAAAGGQVTEEDLRAVAPVWSKPLEVEYGFSRLLMPNNNAGQVFRDIWGELVKEPGLWRQASIDRSRFAEVIGKADARFGNNPPIGSDNAIGLVTADGNGLVVACGFTMGPAFGALRYAKGTGLMLAPAPKGGVDQHSLLLPIIGVSPNIKQVFLGVAATGGALAPAAAFETVAQLTAGGKRAPEALASPRLFWAGPGSIMLYEGGTPESVVAPARAQGVDTVQMNVIGQVNVLHCTEALPRVPGSCGFRADPRGHGLAAGGNF